MFRSSTGHHCQRYSTLHHQYHHHHHHNIHHHHHDNHHSRHGDQAAKSVNDMFMSPLLAPKEVIRRSKE